MSWRWRSRRAGQRSPCSRAMGVDPSMSLNRKVTVPLGSSGIVRSVRRRRSRQQPSPPPPDTGIEVGRAPRALPLRRPMTAPVTVPRRAARLRSAPPAAYRLLAERPVAAAVLGALVIAFSAIFVRLADVPPSTAAVFRCAYALPALALLAWWEQRAYGPRAAGQRRLAVIAGLFFAADLVLWHHAIAAVGAGLATVLGNTQVVMVALAAWLLLGERPDRRVLISVPIVFVGIVLISGVIGADAYGRDPVLGSVFGVLKGAAYTGFLLVQRRANADERRPAGPLFDATLAAAVASAAIGFPLRELDLV